MVSSNRVSWATLPSLLERLFVLSCVIRMTSFVQCGDVGSCYCQLGRQLLKIMERVDRRAEPLMSARGSLDSGLFNQKWVFLIRK